MGNRKPEMGGADSRLVRPESPGRHASSPTRNSHGGTLKALFGVIEHVYLKVLDKIPKIDRKHAPLVLILVLVLVAAVVVLVVYFLSAPFNGRGHVERPDPPPNAPGKELSPAPVLASLAPTSQPDCLYGFSSPTLFAATVLSGRVERALAVIDRTANVLDGGQPRRFAVDVRRDLSNTANVALDPLGTAKTLWGALPYGAYTVSVAPDSGGHIGEPITQCFSYVFALRSLPVNDRLSGNDNNCFMLSDSHTIVLKQRDVPGQSSANFPVKFPFKDRFVAYMAFKMVATDKAEMPSVRLSFCNRFSRETLAPILSIYVPDGHEDTFTICTIADDEVERRLRMKVGGAVERYKAQFNRLRAERTRSTNNGFEVCTDGSMVNCVLLSVLPSAVAARTRYDLYASHNAPPKMGDEAALVFGRDCASPPFHVADDMGVQLAACKGLFVEILDFQIAEVWDETANKAAVMTLEKQWGP